MITFEIRKSASNRPTMIKSMDHFLYVLIAGPNNMTAKQNMDLLPNKCAAILWLTMLQYCCTLHNGSIFLAPSTWLRAGGSSGKLKTDRHKKHIRKCCGLGKNSGASNPIRPSQIVCRKLYASWQSCYVRPRALWLIAQTLLQVGWSIKISDTVHGSE